LCVALAALGLFLYEQYLDGEIAKAKEQMSEASDQIDSEVQQKLVDFDIRLAAASQLLERHIAPSRVLSLLGESTLESVEFNTLTFEANDFSNVALKLEGSTQDFAHVAAQADVLRSNTELQNALVSGLSISRRTEDDGVAFTLEAQVKPKFVRYVSRRSSQSSTNNEAAEGGAFNGDTFADDEDLSNAFEDAFENAFEDEDATSTDADPAESDSQ